MCEGVSFPSSGWKALEKPSDWSSFIHLPTAWDQSMWPVVESSEELSPGSRLASVDVVWQWKREPRRSRAWGLGPFITLSLTTHLQQPHLLPSSPQQISLDQLQIVSSAHSFKSMWARCRRIAKCNLIMSLHLSLNAEVISIPPSPSWPSDQ